MENREQQILSEIKSMMASIRSQLELLDAKMAELQQVVDPEEFEAESVDLDIDVEETMEVVMVEDVTVQEIPMEEALDDDLPFDDVPAEAEVALDDDLPEAAEEPVAAEEPKTVAEEPQAVMEEDDLPGVFDEPEAVTVASKAKAAAKPTVNDMMASDCAWRKDMPGAKVRDVRSAISLNDRVIFINLLFEEDAQKFVNTLTKVNAMETLDQVVEYISAEFPAWNMNSDLVYRFMMAVRRKVQ